MENTTEESHLLVLLGNGFDLAHGLKTSYSDLMDYLLEETRKNSTKKPPFIKLYKKDGETKEDPYLAMTHNSKLGKKVLTTKPNSNSILFRFLFENFNTTKTWGDFEETYFRVLYGHKGDSKLDTQNNRIDIINKEFEHLRKLLEDYLTGVEDKIDEDQIQSYINENSVYELLSQKTKNHLSINIINFNYTSKIANVINEKLFIPLTHFDISGREGTYYKKSKIFHIHGKINSTENPIIFGYGNDRSEKFKELLQYRNDDLMKYMKTFLNKQNIVNNHINYYLGVGNTKVIVLGHSLSDTDSSILNKIFKHKNVKSIELVYHQDKSKYKKNLIQFARIVDDQNIIDQKVLSREETGFIP